jgi:hypothetical protein
MSNSAYKESLRKLQEIAENFFCSVCEFKNEIKNLQQDGQDSHIHQELYKTFNDAFLDEMIGSLISIVYKKTREELCDHEFVSDRVETGVEQDMTDIQYCKHCNIVEKI